MAATTITHTEISRHLDRALREGDVGQAWQTARRLHAVRLDQALALVLLLGRAKDPRFEIAARRFLARFIAEAEPRLGQVSKVADALATVGRVGDLPAMRQGAEQAIEDLGRQLRARR